MGPDDKVPDDKGPDDKGPDDKGPDDKGPDDKGPDDKGPDDNGPDEDVPPVMGERTKMFILSMYKNWLYVLTYIIGAVIISIRFGTHKWKIVNAFNGIITIIVAIAVGWGVHYVSHNVSFVDMYKLTPIHKIIKEHLAIVDWVILRICKIIDFHDTDHHDTTINKRWVNVATEFIQNIVTTSISFIIVNIICDLNFNNIIILSYGLIYAITHNVLYFEGESLTHIQHHEDKYTNYGLDFVDILMGTKFDKTIEPYNHHSYLVAGVYATLYALLTITT